MRIFLTEKTSPAENVLDDALSSVSFRKQGDVVLACYLSVFPVNLSLLVGVKKGTPRSLLQVTTRLNNR